MIDWELSLQAPDGAFPGHFGEAGSRPVIFNQGQIMHGLVAGYTSLDRQDCLEAGVRAGHWLAAQQDDDGCYRKFEHNGVPHVYNTRAIWALAAMGVVANEPGFVESARRNLDWALTQQTPSGWFATNAFVPGRHPFTHTIAYAIRGFLEAAVLLGEERYLQAAERAARGLMAQQRSDGWLAGTYDDGWTPTASYACVTGVAQMALCWLRLAQIGGDQRYREAAWRAIAYVKRTQRLEEKDPVIRGAIPGSAPIWGAYSRFEFPNWAAKFFADALMMDMANVAVPPVAGGGKRAGAMSRLRLMILCGRSARHLHVANALCRAGEALAIVQETGGEWNLKKTLRKLRPDNLFRKGLALAARPPPLHRQSRGEVLFSRKRTPARSSGTAA